VSMGSNFTLWNEIVVFCLNDILVSSTTQRNDSHKKKQNLSWLRLQRGNPLPNDWRLLSGDTARSWRSQCETGSLGGNSFDTMVDNRVAAIRQQGTENLL
jgi:hypothetical protein